MSFFEISLQNIILWTMAGIAAAYYIHENDRRRVSGGFTLTLIFATLGALLTGYLTSFITGKAMLSLSIDGLILAAAGAAFLAYFYRFSFSKRR